MEKIAPFIAATKKSDSPKSVIMVINGFLSAISLSRSDSHLQQAEHLPVLSVSQFASRLFESEPFGELDLVNRHPDPPGDRCHQKVVDSLWLEPAFVTRSVVVTHNHELPDDPAFEPRLLSHFS